MQQNSYIKFYQSTSSTELKEIAFDKDLYHKEVRYAALHILSQREEGLSDKEQLALTELIDQIQKEEQAAKKLEEKIQASKLLEENSPILELYSPNAILGFSIFFSVILGGILMFFNFSKIGKKKKGWEVIAIAFLISVLAFVVHKFFIASQWVMLIANILGGVIFLEYYWKKYFANQLNYSKKSIAKVLLYALLFSFILLEVSIYLEQNRSIFN